MSTELKAILAQTGRSTSIEKLPQPLRLLPRCQGGMTAHPQEVDRATNDS